MKLTDNEIRHIVEILENHLRSVENQMHGTSGELRSLLTREFADTHRLIKSFLESTRCVK